MPASAAFRQAATQALKLQKVSDADKLALYRLYKRVTCGDQLPPKPGLFQLQEQAKWQAWHNVQRLKPADAERRYIEHVQRLQKSH